jgi:hypothetical protein
MLKGGKARGGVGSSAEILLGREMLSVTDVTQPIAGSREAVRTKHQRNEVLGLIGASEDSDFRNCRLLKVVYQKATTDFKLRSGSSFSVSIRILTYCLDAGSAHTLPPDARGAEPPRKSSGENSWSSRTPEIGSRGALRSRVPAERRRSP